MLMICLVTSQLPSHLWKAKGWKPSKFERDLLSLSQVGEVHQKVLTKIYQMSVIFITLLLRVTLFNLVCLESVI